MRWWEPTPPLPAKPGTCESCGTDSDALMECDECGRWMCTSHLTLLADAPGWEGQELRVCKPCEIEDDFR